MARPPGSKNKKTLARLAKQKADMEAALAASGAVPNDTLPAPIDVEVTPSQDPPPEIPPAAPPAAPPAEVDEPIDLVLNDEDSDDEPAPKLPPKPAPKPPRKRPVDTSGEKRSDLPVTKPVVATPPRKRFPGGMRG